jgi:hypothetical protein
MVVKLHRLLIKRARLQLVVEEEVDCLTVQLDRQTLQKVDIVVHKFIVLGKVEVVRNELVKERIAQQVVDSSLHLDVLNQHANKLNDLDADESVV